MSQEAVGLKTIGYHLVISLFIAAPAGGFIFGILNPGDPDPNPIGRLVYACIMAVLTPLHAGFPPNNVAGAGQSFNIWPQIVVGFFLSFTGLSLWRPSRIKIRRRSENNSIRQ